MSNLVPFQQPLLKNIIMISTELVILQTLRTGYEYEMQCSNKQEVKNFRTSAILAAARDILDNLSPFMEYLAACEDGTIDIPKEQMENLRYLMKDCTSFYNWAIGEVKLKNQRLALMDLENQWKSEEK